MPLDLLVRKAWSSSVAFAKECIKKPVLYSALGLGLACGGADPRNDPSILITDAATDASSDGSRYDGPRRMGKIGRDMQVSGKDMSSGVGNDLGTDMYSPRGDAYSRNDAGVDKAVDASSVRGADGRSYADANYDSGAENDLGEERIDAARADEGLRARTDGQVRADAGILADSGYFPDAGAGADLGSDAAPDAAICEPCPIQYEGCCWDRTPEERRMVYADAVEWCANLERFGRNNWRLPTMNELESLCSCPGCGYQEGDGWTQTSETVSEGTQDPWVIGFHQGCRRSDGGSWVEYLVRCVSCEP